MNTPTNSFLYAQAVTSRCFFLFSPRPANWVSGQGPCPMAGRLATTGVLLFPGSRISRCSALGWGQAGTGRHCNSALRKTKSRHHGQSRGRPWKEVPSAQRGGGAEGISQRRMEGKGQLQARAYCLGVQSQRHRNTCSIARHVTMGDEAAPAPEPTQCPLSRSELSPCPVLPATVFPLPPRLHFSLSKYLPCSRFVVLGAGGITATKMGYLPSRGLFRDVNCSLTWT